MSAFIVPEIHAGRRAFAAAQQLLQGAPVAAGPTRSVAVGWHGSSVDPEDGSFAVVGFTAGLDDLVGSIVQIDAGAAQVYAYVLTSADVPVDLSVTRRLFIALGRLTLESIDGTVTEIVH